MRSVIDYSAARILVFVLTLGVLYLFGARGFLLLALAVLVSGVVSLVLLSRLRDAVSSVIADSVESGRRRFEAARSAEDFEPEDEAGAHAPPAPAVRSESAVSMVKPQQEQETETAPEPTAPAKQVALDKQVAPPKHAEPSGAAERGR